MNKEDRVFEVIGMSPRDDKDGRSFWDEFFAKGYHLPQHKYDAMVERKKNKVDRLDNKKDKKQ